MISERSEKFPFELLNAFRADADFRTPVIERSDYGVCTVEYIVSGGGSLETNGESFAPKKDGVYFLHKHSFHRYWPDREDPWHKLCFVVDGGLMEYLFAVYGVDRIQSLDNAPQLRSFFEAMLQLGHSGTGRNRRAAVIFHQFVEACAALGFAPEEPVHPEMEELRKAIDRSVEKKFVLAAYAAQHKLSEAHLIRCFRAAFGRTPCDYLIAKRIEAGERMLKYTHLSVKEIAGNLAFSDQYYFSNSFRKRTGVSPSEYRKLYGK